MITTHHSQSQSRFELAPSVEGERGTQLTATASIPPDAHSLGVFLASPEDGRGELQAAFLRAQGFAGKVGQALLLPRAKGAALVAIGYSGKSASVLSRIRDAAAAFARTVAPHSHLALELPILEEHTPEEIAQVVVEGVLLARYRYLAFKGVPEGQVGLSELCLVTSEDSVEAAMKGARRGGVMARATHLARDLANAPATLLTASRLGELAVRLGAQSGLGVELFDGDALSALGCGGLLGVNAGSVEPPQMVKLTYEPKTGRGPLARVALVGKGIMFDSGGLGLKANDLVHATMKGDMSGAGAILAAMCALRELECPIAVTGYLMCTDNMPSATAMKLGDVLIIRGGKTVEVVNPDAEGRLVMADALVLATEERPTPDAIVDIATLTGACQRALGIYSAGVMGNVPELVEQVRRAGERTDETVWPLPLDARYRKELESEVADMKNVGGDNAGALTAGLFLEEFVGGIPWVHIDMAGTARCEADEAWRTKGATGYGARVLIDLLLHFSPPGPTRH